MEEVDVGKVSNGCQAGCCGEIAGIQLKCSSDFHPCTSQALPHYCHHMKKSCNSITVNEPMRGLDTRMGSQGDRKS
jgi:hypothetical protein